MIREIVIPYRRRPQQREVHALCRKHRFGVVVAHRRMGKSVLFFNHLQRSALMSDPKTASNWRGAFIGPTYTQAKGILWDHAKHYSAGIPGRKVNESELWIEFASGARIRLYGADNPDSLRGLYFDEVVFDEFDLMRMEVWTSVVRPAISDRRGNAYFIGTFKGEGGPLGEIYDLAEETEGWFTRVYPASETGVLPQSELDEMRAAMSPEEYAREFECVRGGAVVGSILGRLVDEADAEGRIREVPHDPALPVDTAWDLGFRDSNAIWFAQRVGAEVRLIDYYEASGEGLPHYARVLQDKGYVYREHIAPHDIAVSELGTGKSRLEIAQGLGIHFRVLPRVSGLERAQVENRIEAARVLLPRCYFDQVKCKPGLEALRAWRRERNERMSAPGKDSFRPTPVHDWASHGADSFTHLAMGLQRVAKVSRPEPNTRWVV